MEGRYFEEEFGEGELTQEDLTILTLNQLKMALHAEKSRSLELQELNEGLIAEYEQRSAELELESIRLQLTLQATCNPGSPSFLVRALIELLPQHLSDNLILTCCIRAGDSWTIVAANRSDQHKIVKTAALDEAARVVRPLAPAALLSLVPRETVKRIVYARDRDVDGGFDEEKIEERGTVLSDYEGLDALLDDSCVLSASARCLWLVTPQARMSGRVTDLANEAAMHLSQMQPVVETASQLAMAALLQQLEAQQVQKDALVGRGATALSLHLFGFGSGSGFGSSRSSSASSSGADVGFAVSNVWAQMPAVLDALIPNACSEVFIVAPNSGTAIDAGAALLAISSSLQPVTLPPCSTEASILGQCCSTGQIQVGGVGQPGTHLKLDCGGDSGVQTAISMPLWMSPPDGGGQGAAGGLPAGYRCVVVVRVRGPRVGVVDAVSALWTMAAPLLRTWLQGSGVLGLLLNPIAAPSSPAFTTTDATAQLLLQPAGPTSSTEALSNLGDYLKTFLNEGEGDSSSSSSSSPTFHVPVAPLADYLGVDWLVALVGSSSSSSSNGGHEQFTLVTPDNHRPFKPDEVSGRLRDLVMALRQPRDDATGGDSIDGLVHFRVEPELQLSSTGVTTLLGAKAVHSRLQRLLPLVPASQCPCFGARIEQRTQRNADAASFTLLLLGGTVWRPRGFSEKDILSKLRGLGRIVQLGAEVRETGLLYSRVYSVTDRLQTELSALQLVCGTAAQKEAQETELLQRLRARVAEVEQGGAGVGVDAEGGSMGGGGLDDDLRVRRALLAALQHFVSRAYLSADVSEKERGPEPLRQVVCQLALSETVTEEGVVRRWLLQPSGEWAVLAPGAASAVPSLSLSAASDQVGAEAHLMTIRGAHRVVRLYSEGSEEGSEEFSSASSSAAAAAAMAAVRAGSAPSSLQAALSVYAIIGWGLLDPSLSSTSTSNPGMAAGMEMEKPPPPPSACIEAAWVALLAASFSKNRTRLLGGAISSSVDGWDAGEASVRAVRAGALAGAKLPLQAYLGSRSFLEGLHSRTPGFALIPIRIQGRADGEEGVWDVTSLPPLSPASQSTPLPAVEQPPRRLPARLSDTILRAAASRLPVPASAATDGVALPEPLPASDVLVVAGGGGSGSSLLALSGMGGCVLSHLVGSDSGVGLTLGLDSEEQQGALRSLGLTRRSLVLLYLAPASAVFHDERERDDDVGGACHLAGFLCVLRGHRLVAPCSFPLLLRLLDGATLPLRLARAIQPLFVGVHDGAKMLMSCWPDPSAQPQHHRSRDPVAVNSGDEEWAKGLPERLSTAWLACSRRDVVRGIAPRGRCVRAASYVLSGLLPTPVSAASAFASGGAGALDGAAAAAAGGGGGVSGGSGVSSPPQAAVLPEWRLVLTSSSDDYQSQSQSQSHSAHTQARGGLVEQEPLLAACPVPVPGAGLIQAAAVASSATSGGADGDVLLSSGSVGGGGNNTAMVGLEVGWEDRALPPSTLASAAGSTRGPARLLRMFVTIPRAWLRGLPLAAALGSSSAGGGRVVIASCLFWLEGVAAPVPAGVRLSLLRGAQQAGGLLGSLLLEACQKVLTASALGMRVLSLRQRSSTQAHSLSCVRSVLLSGARVARTCCNGDVVVDADAGTTDLSAAGPLRQLPHDIEALITALVSSDERLTAARDSRRRALALHQAVLSVGAAELGGSADDELAALSSAPNQDSLVDFEDSWMQITVEAAGEACSLMAMTIDQLKAEKADCAALRRQLAAARVAARETAESLRAFAIEVGRVLPASNALLQLESELANAECYPADAVDAPGSNVHVSLVYTDCVCEMTALTTRALSELLELCCRLGLREEASQALAAACSPVVHPALLSPSQSSSQARVDWDARGVVVVWTDGSAPSAEPPALGELLSFDLLRAAWRRGLSVTGAVQLRALSEAHPHWVLTAGGKYQAEYVPFPRVVAGERLGAEAGEDPVDAYPQFVVQYLVPALSERQQGGDEDEDGGEDGGERERRTRKIALSRAWLEDMLDGLTAPVQAQAQTLATDPSPSHDTSSALAGLLAASSVRLDASTFPVTSASWAGFAAAAGLYLAALLRSDACLLLPDSAGGGGGGGVGGGGVIVEGEGEGGREREGEGEGAGGGVDDGGSDNRAAASGNEDEDGDGDAIESSSAAKALTTQMWGTVARFSKGLAHSDPGPMVLTSGQMETLARRAGCLDALSLLLLRNQGHGQGRGRGAAATICAPVLLELGPGGQGPLSGGGGCLIALPLAVPAPAPSFEPATAHASTVWFIVVQATRRLGPCDCDSLQAAGRLLTALSAARVHRAETAGMAVSLRRCQWLRDLLGHVLEVSRAIRGGAGEGSGAALTPSADSSGVDASPSLSSLSVATSQAQARVEEEEQRVSAAVAEHLPALPLLGATSAALVPLSRAAVQRARQWTRGGDEAGMGSPSAAAHCLAVWGLVMTAGGEVCVPVALFGRDSDADADDRDVDGQSHGESSEDNDVAEARHCWALQINFAADSPCLRALALVATNSSSSNRDGSQNSASAASASEQRGHAQILSQALGSLADDARRCLLLPRLFARLLAARSRNHRAALLASEAASGAGALAQAMAGVLAHNGPTGAAMPALGAALALCLAPREGGGSKAILAARLHWLDQPQLLHAQFETTAGPSPPSPTHSHSPAVAAAATPTLAPASSPYHLEHWLTSDPLVEGSDEGLPRISTHVLPDGEVEEGAVHRMLRLGHWQVRESPASAVALSRATPVGPGRPARFTVVAEDSGLGGGVGVGGGGGRCVRVWLNVSSGAQLALLELRVPAALVEQQAHLAPLQSLQYGIAQAVSCVASGCVLRAQTLVAERALQLSRGQAAVLAACLGELCTEGRAPEGYTGPSCGFIGVMLQRIQAEINKLPGVRGVRVSCRDTVEGVELYNTYSASAGQSAAHPPALPVPRGPLHGASSSPAAAAAYNRPVSVTVVSGGELCSPLRQDAAGGGAMGSPSPQGARPSYTFGGGGGGCGGGGDCESGEDQQHQQQQHQQQQQQGSEFAFSCGEISGALTLYFVAGQNDADEGRLFIGPHAPEHRQVNTAVLVALSRALARRIFELHRGHRNQQLMIRQQKSSASIKAELAARHELALELESAKSVALTQLQQVQEDNETLRAQLRAEKGVAAEAVQAHKNLAKQLQRVTTDLKSESSRELTDVKAEAHRAETVAQAELARRDAIIAMLRDERKAGDKAKRELAVSLEREKSLDTNRYELALNCSELEALSVKQRAELAELQAALADCRRQISTMEADRRSSHDLAALYRQEKSRADSLQAFVDLLKQ